MGYPTLKKAWLACRGAHWWVQRVWQCMPVCWVVRVWAKTLGAGGTVLPTPSCSCSHVSRTLSRLEVTGDTDLIVVRAVCGLLHRCVFFVIAHLHTHHRVHVQAHQLPSLNHCDADLWEGKRGLHEAAILESSRPRAWD